MGWNTAIRVISENGSPKKGARVSIIFFGFLGGYSKEYTDSDGWANFDIPSANEYRMIINSIYVNGEEVDSDLGIDRGEKKSYTV